MKNTFNIEIHPALLSNKLRDIASATDSLHKYIVLDATEGGLRLKGANLYIELASTLMKSTIHKPGQVGVEHQAFTRIINAIKTGCTSIQLKLDGDDLIISSESGSYPIPTKDVNDIPLRLKQIEGQELFTAHVDASTFKHALEVASKTAPNQDAQAELNGVQVTLSETNPEKLLICGLERSRMNVSRMKANSSTGFGDVVLPMHSTIPHLLKSLQTEGEIVIEAEIACVRITLPSGETVISKVLDSKKFPEWKKLLEEKFEKQIELDKAQLLAVLTRMEAFSTMRFQKVTLTVTGNSLTLSQDENGRKANEVISIVNNGSDFELAFQVHFLKDILQSVTKSDTQIRLLFSAHGMLQTFSSDGNSLGIVSNCRV